jgi:SAM-dependent methyltransferase
MACGSGYGAAALAATAGPVTAIDVSAEAIEYAAANYRRPNLTFLEASCTETPFPPASFDLIVAFEVIEHLADWRMMLAEARRLLAPGGQFIVSTPNAAYYGESRGEAGDNPFHVHEFDFEEIQAALTQAFPHVSFFVQNHSYGVAIQPLAGASGVDVRLESTTPKPDEAHFILAVCALAPQTGAPSYVYLPASANVLREREHHIARLNGELAQKDAWLQKSLAEHQELVSRHNAVQDELKKSNAWAEQLNEDLTKTNHRIAQLQDELASEQLAGRDTAAAYDAKVIALESDLKERTAWAESIEARMNAEIQVKTEDLAKCVALLDKAEKTVVERTEWAQALDSQRAALEQELEALKQSRWLKIGARIGLGPLANK